MPGTVTLTVEEYEDLLDTRQAALQMARLASGEEEKIPADRADEYLSAPTPLHFWRRHRGMTQAALAVEIGVTQAYLSQLESGTRTGPVHVYAALARALRLRIEDLVTE